MSSPSLFSFYKPNKAEIKLRISWENSCGSIKSNKTYLGICFLLRHHQVSLHFAKQTDAKVSRYPYTVYYFCSNHCDFFNTATQKLFSLSLSVRRNAPHADWCLKLEQGRKQTCRACLRTKAKKTKTKITHLIVGCLGRAEACINHNEDTYWSSAGFTQVMISERIEGAERWIFGIDFLHIYSYKNV